MRRHHRRWLAAVLVPLIIGLILPVGPFLAQADARTSSPSILIIYDSLDVGTEQEGNVEVLKRLLAAFQVQVTVQSIDTYTSGELKGYSGLIEVQNRSDLTDEDSDYFKDLQSYSGDILYIGGSPRSKLIHTLGLQVQAVEKMADLSIGPFAEKSIHLTSIYNSNAPDVQRYGTLKVQDANYAYGMSKGGYAYVPFLEKDTLSEMALSYVLKGWLQHGENGHNYLLFKEIYPFSNLPLLERMSDELFEAGIPFIISVHPVFNNTDYPAMKRYINTLKYVQSRNGTILVESPVVATTIQDLDRSLYRQMEHFIDVLAEAGVVPLGMGTEMYWSYDEHFVQEGMSFFDSVVLFPDKRPIHKEELNRSQAFHSSLYSVTQPYLQRYLIDGRMIDPPSMNMAITYDFVQTEEELESLTNQLRNSWINFDDYKNEAHLVTTEANQLGSERGSLVLNGTNIGIQASHVETSSDYEYKQQEQKSFETWFSVQNRIFIIIIFITLFVFSGFLIIGYRMYKRKFYK
ncbi:MAG TPA: hypothetical protein VGN02_07270 [Paenibacillus sp.]